MGKINIDDIDCIVIEAADFSLAEDKPHRFPPMMRDGKIVGRVISLNIGDSGISITCALDYKELGTGDNFITHWRDRSRNRISDRAAAHRAQRHIGRHGVAR